MEIFQSAKRKRNPDYRTESEIYLVERIMARSWEQSVGPSGKLEHQYLVRWADYKPKDDTWEYRSNLQYGSSHVVRKFDSKRKSNTHLLSHRLGFCEDR